ncbi:transposase [Candidatus Enterovibrio altilux]|uniref:transposase n=1 Tax=Candidatus Enterovibrio altilux TaxID=1927128 RepID=UPI001CC23E82
MKCELIEFSGEDNHVHMMVAVRPTIAVASLVGKSKGKFFYYSYCRVGFGLVPVIGSLKREL